MPNVNPNYHIQKTEKKRDKLEKLEVVFIFWFSGQNIFVHRKRPLHCQTRISQEKNFNENWQPSIFNSWFSICHMPQHNFLKIISCPFFLIPTSHSIHYRKDPVQMICNRTTQYRQFTNSTWFTQGKSSEFNMSYKIYFEILLFIQTWEDGNLRSRRAR